MGEGELEGGGEMGAEGSGDAGGIFSTEDGVSGPGQIDFVDGIKFGEGPDE